MPELAVTDTHALVWYATGVHRKLGRRALRLFGRADAGLATIYVPTIVLVEVAEIVRAGRIDLGRAFAEWEEALFASGKYIPAALTREVVRSAEALYRIPERGDRLIAATALRLGCALITRDPAIGKATDVPMIW